MPDSVTPTFFDGRVPAPVYVTLETTRYCNLRCRMCLPYMDGITVKGPHMSMGVYRELAKQLFPFAKRFQPSVSGEPTMSKGFMDMLGIAESYGVKVELCTNGTLLSEPRIKTMVRSLGLIKISFDGTTAETFERIREGAKFEKVVRNIKALVRTVRSMKPEQRPIVSLACTLMESNVRELPEMVRMAHSLGADSLSANHVFPATEEIKSQSLVHHPELGQKYIAEAVEEARRLGSTLQIFALDHITADTATGQGVDRKLAVEDGVMAQFPAVSVNATEESYPTLSQEQDGYEGIMERRREGRKKYWFPSAPAAAKLDEASPDQSIWVCDYLWSHTWCEVDGVVRSCCITGAPAVGIVEAQRSFDQVWNNRIMRVMRQRLAVKDPVPVCRGCRMIKEVSDPADLHHYLGGNLLPAQKELEDVPALLRESGTDSEIDRHVLEQSLAGDRPVPGGSATSYDWPRWPEERDPETTRIPASDSPTLEWPRIWEGRYVLEVSLHQNDEILFATSREDPLVEPSFQFPEDYWTEAPDGVAFEWRILLLNPSPAQVMWRGRIEKVG